MPYYSELGIYTPSSTYTSTFLKGPYSNHSSILASNILPPSSKHFNRGNFRGYKPHLTTISESSSLSPLRRISSPKLIYHSSPKVKVPRPIKINTADIDVSVNKYRRYDSAKPKSEIVEKSKSPSPRKELSKTPSPKKELSKTPSPRKKSPPPEEKEAKPNTKISRDRATIRLHTIHKDALNKEIGEIKSWRDNFKPEELITEAKVRKKTPGELLKEKFLIRSKSKENIPKLDAPKLTRKSSVRKSPSFKDICNEISSDSAIEDLNPGQPLAVRRRQSRQVSQDDILRELKRSSSTLSVEEVELLDALINADNHLSLSDVPIPEDEKTSTTSNGVKKKRLTKKRSSEKLTVANSDVPRSSSSEDVSSRLNCNEETPLKRRNTQKKLRKSPSDRSIIDESAFPDIVEDISQVEIEIVPVKHKPIITGSVGDIEEKVKPNFKAVINDLQVEEKPNPKKDKKFRFNVTVEEIPVKPKITAAKFDLNKARGVVQLPKGQRPVVVSILKKRSHVQQLQDLGEPKVLKKKEVKKPEEIKAPIVKSKSEVVVKKVGEANLQKSDSNTNVSYTILTTLSKAKSDESVVEKPPETEKEGSRKLKIVSVQQEKKTSVDQTKELGTSKPKIIPEKQQLKELKQKQPQLQKTPQPKPLQQPKKAHLERNSANCLNKALKPNDEKDHQDQLPKLGPINLAEKDPKEFLQEIQESQQEVEDTVDIKEKKMTSKRSLIQKANKEDPDLVVFEPPEIEPEPVKEPSPEPAFVPLQSNRLSQWMHPWKKPEQKEKCPVEIYAKPKFIRARHIPRRWQQQESEDSTTSDEDSEEDTSEDDSDEESEAEEETERTSTKIGASTSSNDSGFDSGRAKDKGSVDNKDSSGTLTPASNPAFALDLNDLPEEVSQSSTYQSFQRSGRITPPATTIPRFRKYCVEDFNFLKVLGKGSFGKVLLAELKSTEYYYAVKCLKKDVVLEDDDVECTLIERKVLALGTKHPYLCHLLCTFQTESHLFFVMEYLNGGDLMFHIQVERRFSEVRARFYGAEIVSGLKFLHNKGIVYRDLKLDNILLDFDGHVRIADFGMCKLQIFLDRMADTFCGTPDYMAPEIIKGQHYNQNVDWWSFGVLLYEMLLGQSPFSGCDEDELFWSICNEKPVIPKFLSAEASSALVQFLEKDANKRLGNRFSVYGDIQDHPFFTPIDWVKLEARQLEPPFKPNLQHPLDTQYFDKTFTIEKAKLTPIETTILGSMDQTQFQGFSYTNPNATDK